MKKQLLITKSLMILLIIGGVLVAQGQNKNKNTMQLDEKKIEQIREIRGKYFKQIELKRLEVQKKRIEIKEILIESFDMTKLEKATYAMHKTMAEMQIIEFKIDSEVRKILTDIEFQHYIKRRELMRKNHGKNRKGGMPHGGNGGQNKRPQCK